MSLDAILKLTVELLDKGHFAEAAEACRQGLQQYPEDARLWSNYASALCDLREHDAAMQAYDQALALEPDNHLLRYNYALALHGMQRNHDAIKQLQICVKLKPAWAKGRHLLAELLHIENDLQAAHQEFAQARKLHPKSLTIAFHEALAQIPICPASAEQVDASRQNYEAKLRDFAAMLDDAEDLRAGLQALKKPPFFLAYTGRVDTHLQQLYGRCVRRVMRAVAPDLDEMPAMTVPEADGRLRIGFVGKYYHGHSVWKLPLRGWLEHLDRRRFRLFCYSTAACPGSRAGELCDSFLESQAPLDELARRIRQDRLHAVIFPEVGMDWKTICLAGLRLAPLQLAGPGHPQTPGLDTVDGFLSSEYMEPPDGQDHYCEQLHPLPKLGACNYPPEETVRMRRRDLNLPEKDILFFSPQSLFKYLPKYDDIFARIIKRVPQAKIVFIRHESSRGVTQCFRKRIETHFKTRNLNPWKHCIFLPRLTSKGFTIACAACDIFLDNPGWSGNNTSLEAIWQELPLVTLPTTLMRGRHAAANLRICDAASTICASVDEYVELAAELAHDKARRDQVREQLRQGKRKAFHDTDCVRGLEELLFREVAERQG